MNKNVARLVLACLVGLVSIGGSVFASVDIKGDYRLRYQAEDISNDGKQSRHRLRMRYRLGMKVNANDNLSLSAGLASGTTDPRSRNLTFSDSSTPKSIGVDYIFLTYKKDKLQAHAGKMKNPLWLISDLQWDGDITPEGLALQASPIDLLDVNAAFFVLDEISGGDDALMFVAQPVVTLPFGNKHKWTFGTGVYVVTGAKGVTLDATAGTNTRADDPVIINLASEIELNELGNGFPSTAIFTEYLANVAASDSNQGILAGLRFGSKKIKAQGHWQTKIQYRDLARDATLDILPDSDFFGGKTGAKGVELIVKYGLAKNMLVALDYYYGENRLNTAQDQHLIQLDFVVKFKDKLKK